MLIDILLLIGAGLVSGYASGLLGIGGGLLRIPIFLHLLPVFGVPAALVMHVAAGTSLSVAVPTSVAAWRSQSKAGNLDAGLLRTWLPALGVGVVVGIVGTRYVSGRVLEAMFAVAVLLAGIRMLGSRSQQGTSHAEPDGPTSGDDSTTLATEEECKDHLPSRPVLTLAAALIGVLSPMLGITGGTFATPTLTFFDYPIHRAVAVSSVGGLVVSVLGTIGFVITGWNATISPGRFVGYVDVLALLVMTPCVLITAPLGVRTANRLGRRSLERLFGLLLLAVALDVAWSVIFWHRT